MKIYLTPVRHDYSLNAEVKGDSIIINGASADFSRLLDGEVLPRSAIDCPWIASDVTRTDGEITLTLVCPHGHNAPHETRFPAALHNPISIKDGIVTMPPYESICVGEL